MALSFAMFLGVVFISLSESRTQPIPVAWVDSIDNPDNAEYVEEVCFNADIVMCPANRKHIQFLFCKRYYETLADSSITWYKRQ